MTPIEVKLSNGKAKLKEGMFLYCPSHGIGKILAIETKEYLGEKLSFCNMEFKQDDMKMLIPINKMKDIGIRQIISKEEAKKVLETVLDKPAKNMKSIWSKRMVEYEAKLYSGDIIFIAEVVRDLFAGCKDPSKSYGERMIFDKALDRFVSEFSVAMGITLEEANKEILDILNKNYNLKHKNSVVKKDKNNEDDFSDEDLDEIDEDEDSSFEDKKSA